MKITVEPKVKEEPKEIPYGDIEPGTVYMVVHGAVLLKLDESEAIALLHSDGENWFVQAKGFIGCPATKILGKLKEIIVEVV